MSPEIKSKELVLKFYVNIPLNLNNGLAKKLALIAVDELIIEEEKYNNGSFYPSKYWQEVKIEIEKL